MNMEIAAPEDGCLQVKQVFQKGVVRQWVWAGFTEASLFTHPIVLGCWGAGGKSGAIACATKVAQGCISYCYVNWKIGWFFVCSRLTA
jgi:hypothetical protein